MLKPFFSPTTQISPFSDTLQQEPPFNIVLFEPLIPQNTGSIARLCGATNTTLHLVHPLGFKTDDKHLKRAGLDYWEFVNIIHWDSIEDLFVQCRIDQLHFLSKKVKTPYTEHTFSRGDYLVFGKETKGLPDEILNTFRDRTCTIPMANVNIRSINLAMSCGIVLYEAIRQVS